MNDYGFNTVLMSDSSAMWYDNRTIWLNDMAEMFQKKFYFGGRVDIMFHRERWRSFLKLDSSYLATNCIKHFYEEVKKEVMEFYDINNLWIEKYQKK